MINAPLLRLPTRHHRDADHAATEQPQELSAGLLSDQDTGRVGQDARQGHQRFQAADGKQRQVWVNVCWCAQASSSERVCGHIRTGALGRFGQIVLSWGARASMACELP